MNIKTKFNIGDKVNLIKDFYPQYLPIRIFVIKYINIYINKNKTAVVYSPNQLNLYGERHLEKID